MRVVGLFDVQRNDQGEPQRPYAYRADLLHEYVDLRVIPRATHPAHQKFRDIFEHRLGMPLDLAIRSHHLVDDTDVVFAFLESFAIFPSTLKRRGATAYAKKPLVALSCWWAEEISTGTENQRNRIKSALSGIDAIVCFSQNQQEMFEKIGYPRHKVHSVPFGVDHSFYHPDPDPVKKLEIVSAGVDRGRDFDTLMKVAEILPHRRFDIFTHPDRISSPPPNVRIHAPVTIDAHRNNLRRAELVVVPTHELQYPTGQSVLLESMACGTATAVTDTPAMREYIRDDQWNFALPRENPVLAAQKIEQILADDPRRSRVAAAGRAQVEATFNFQRTWEAVAEVLSKVAICKSEQPTTD